MSRKGMLGEHAGRQFLRTGRASNTLGGRMPAVKSSQKSLRQLTIAGGPSLSMKLRRLIYVDAAMIQ